MNLARPDFGLDQLRQDHVERDLETRLARGHGWQHEDTAGIERERVLADSLHLEVAVEDQRQLDGIGRQAFLCPGINGNQWFEDQRQAIAGNAGDDVFAVIAIEAAGVGSFDHDTLTGGETVVGKAAAAAAQRQIGQIVAEGQDVVEQQRLGITDTDQVALDPAFSLEVAEIGAGAARQRGIAAVVCEDDGTVENLHRSQAADGFIIGGGNGLTGIIEIAIRVAVDRGDVGQAVGQNGDVDVGVRFHRQAQPVVVAFAAVGNEHLGECVRTAGKGRAAIDNQRRLPGATETSDRVAAIVAVGTVDRDRVADIEARGLPVEVGDDLPAAGATDEIELPGFGDIFKLFVFAELKL